MTAALTWADGFSEYRFGPGHPMLPERYTLAVDLMRAWDLIGQSAGHAEEVVPEAATDEDLLRVHDAAYLDVVKNGGTSGRADQAYGLGEGDTPRFAHMHEVTALIAGSTIRALDGVLDGEWTRAFNPAGGLHHAHRDRAAGFCVYNDCAVAIARATALRPRLRVAYVDIDAHHGDGVQEAFWTRDDVLTVSVHESGQYLYPGTGAATDTGAGDGVGYAVNVPLPPYAGPAEYELVFDSVVEPVLGAFAPDVIVAQLGADTHRDDPLAHLALTVRGHASLVARLADCADRLCDGRLAATGGGGYEAFSATPRMWASAMALLIGGEVPRELPASWVHRAGEAALAAGFSPNAGAGTFDERPAPPPGLPAEEIRRLTERAIEAARAASPLLARGR